MGNVNVIESIGIPFFIVIIENVNDNNGKLLGLLLIQVSKIDSSMLK